MIFEIHVLFYLFSAERLNLQNWNRWNIRVIMYFKHNVPLSLRVRQITLVRRSLLYRLCIQTDISDSPLLTPIQSFYFITQQHKSFTLKLHFSTHGQVLGIWNNVRRPELQYQSVILTDPHLGLFSFNSCLSMLSEFRKINQTIICLQT